MKQITYAKIGENRGKRRIWIEGKKLAEAGFLRGKKYVTTMVFDGERSEITLTLDEGGDKKVAGRTRNGKDCPIIDLQSMDITKFAESFNRVKVELYEGLIVITPHHEDIKQNGREARARTSGTKTTGTICSGAGVATAAISEGMKESGIIASCEWMLDREGAYLDVAQQNHDIALVIQGEAEEVETVPEVDIVQVSLPCTGHSKSGRSKHGISCGEFHPTDATAVIGALRLIELANPSVIISENVTEAQGSASYALITGYLSRLGYRISEFTLDGEFAGTLERRKRYWFVATSSNLPAFDPSDLQSFCRVQKCLGEVLQDIPRDSKRWKEFKYLAEKEVLDIAAGKGFKRQLKTAVDTFVGTIGRHYAKCRSTEPFIQREDGMSRLLTPIEHARVKRIPESYINGVADTTAHQILGQSVLWTQAQAIGRVVGDWFANLEEIKE